jgi:hypothetical protein
MFCIFLIMIIYLFKPSVIESSELQKHLSPDIKKKAKSNNCS